MVISDPELAAYADAVKSAAMICRQVNSNPIVGQRRNFADPRFEYLYRRREPLVQEPL